VALVVRTITLRAALLLTTYAVTVGASGPDRAGSLATHVVALTLWSFLAFVLDAIAIAAQAITGRYLGAGDVAGTRAVTRRMGQGGADGGGGGGRVPVGCVGRGVVRAAPGGGRALPRAALQQRPEGARPAGAGAARRCARAAGRR